MNTPHNMCLCSHTTQHVPMLTHHTTCAYAHLNTPHNMCLCSFGHTTQHVPMLIWTHHTTCAYAHTPHNMCLCSFGHTTQHVPMLIHNALRMNSSDEHNTYHLIYNFLRVFLLITPLVHTQPSVISPQSMDLCPSFESWGGTDDNMYTTYSSGPPGRSIREKKWPYCVLGIMNGWVKMAQKESIRGFF